VNKPHKKDKTFLIILSELIFTFFPLLIASILICFKKNYSEIITNSDWSYISIILFGQTIIKFFSGVAQNNNQKSLPVLLVILTLILMFGLVPSVTILILLEISNDKPLWLIISQWLFVVVSVGAFCTIGHIGQLLNDNKLISEQDVS